VAPYAGLALIGAAAAVCFVVVSSLFDVLGYPHVTYIFLYIAGLVAVVVQPPAPPPLRLVPRLGRDHAFVRRSATRKSPAMRGVH